MVPICQSQRSGDAKRICEIFTQKSRIPTMTKREAFMLLGLTRFIARFQSKKMCHATFWGNFHKCSIFWALPTSKRTKSWCILPRSRHRYWNRTGRYKRPRHCTSINDTSVFCGSNCSNGNGDLDVFFRHPPPKSKTNAKFGGKCHETCYTCNTC